MGAYPKLVQLAWEVTEQFIKEWKNDPYKWENEFSIQSELIQRLKTVYQLIGQDTIKANYTANIPKQYHNKQNWSRVSPEPLLSYRFGNERFACHPDIAIWDEISDPNSPPDEDKYVNWPALWVCEIKIESDFDDDNVWDLDKIKRLNKFKSSLQYGCWLNFNYKVRSDSPNIKWELVDGSDNIYKTNIYMPDIK